MQQLIRTLLSQTRMMKNLPTYLLIVLCGCASFANAQIAYKYINAEVNNSLGFTSTDPFRFSTKDMNLDPRFEYRNETFVTKFLGINYGISFGLVLHSGNKWEFGFSGAESKTGFIVYQKSLNTFGADSVYSARRRGSFSGHNFIQLRALYYKNVFKESERNYLICGAMLGISQRNQSRGSFSSTEFDEGYEIKIYNTHGKWKAKNLFLVIGFEHKVYLKKTYLFNASAFLNTAITKNIFTSKDVDIHVIENGQVDKFSYGSYSRGSGVLIQLSRTFTLKKKPKKQE